MNFNPASLRNSLMHTKIMEWTNDDALELIEQYRSHTELWNRADPKYKDKLCRFRAWSEIAERFGCSKAEVERKMNVLLTQYRREKHKMLVKLYQGIQPNPSKWYAFKRFDFMEAGGGSASALAAGIAGGGGGVAGGGGGINVSLNCSGSSNSGITTNGHHHHHAAAAAAAAALNGLAAAGYDTSTAAAAAPTTSHHRRMKSKEMKYFGAMGLNLPMLLANSQPLETWNPVGQFSPPPISERNHQLRVPLPMPFSNTPQSELNTSGTSSGGGGGVIGSGPRSLFGGSSNSDFTGSPQKPMDTTDIENDEGKEHDTKCERTTPSNLHDTSVTSNDGRLSTGPNGTPGAVGSENGTCPGDVGSGGMSSGGGGGGTGRRSDGTSGTEAGSSPIPNTNTFEAHKQRHLIPGGAVSSGSRGHDDLDIKQELLENYFHAPHPPAPPDSHRSYSSTDENRHGAESADDFAQDLRVSAAAAAAAKGLDFSRFVLPPSLRRSTESIDEKFTPLNMRKLNPTSASSSQAGQMLMNSLLSNESMSEDNTSISGRIKSGSLSGNPNGMSGSQDASSSAAAAAAAAAIYAESLNKDDCDFIGSNVSVKLRAMDRTQRIIAEKLISEVLFYGQFNELERSARIQPK
ncbi:trinucleotide repeat-containing gene 6C protein [Lucilia sericata]|uniref:trinucleotide repeat-containing gene 6C protein n=1 Tax=Lucilia sericata TaxID=13632 RepID=UPI0018A84F3B|nr:trinucleotide repeat-containing gene 6C protein [Lucilia sericata]XP_037823885.1 trinucleotide repeat-containing gene 6C protein [Lucilia sericata]